MHTTSCCVFWGGGGGGGEGIKVVLFARIGWNLMYECVSRVHICTIVVVRMEQQEKKVGLKYKALS